MKLTGNEIVLLVIWLHWLGDFVFQTNVMAQNKSKSNTWLAIHIMAYSAVLMIFLGPVYALVNGLAHFCTDWVTSRWTSKLWQKGDRHNFFVVIGLDQALHLTVLILTLPLARWGIGK